MNDLENAVQDALVMIDASARFEDTVSGQLITMTEFMTRQQAALSAMLDLFFINRMRLAKGGSLPMLLDLLKVARDAHTHIQDSAIEIGLALKKACEDVSEKTG